MGRITKDYLAMGLRNFATSPTFKPLGFAAKDQQRSSPWYAGSPTTWTTSNIALQHVVIVNIFLQLGQDNKRHSLSETFKHSSLEAYPFLILMWCRMHDAENTIDTSKTHLQMKQWFVYPILVTFRLKSTEPANCRDTQKKLSREHEIEKILHVSSQAP